MKEQTTIKKRLIIFIKLFALLILAAHFILTFLYVMPITPIKLKHQHLLNATIGSFFPQNWSLFAPSPVARNESVLVTCVPENSQISDIEQVPSEGWKDITLPLWQALQHNRLTAYGRIERTQENAIRQYLGSLPELESWRESCRKGAEESCKVYEEQLKDAKKKGEQKLVKIASSFCRETNADEIQKVAIRIRVDSTLSWSKRYSEKREDSDTNVGVFPIDSEAVLPGIYQASVR